MRQAEIKWVYMSHRRHQPQTSEIFSILNMPSKTEKKWSNVHDGWSECSLDSFVWEQCSLNETSQPRQISSTILLRKTNLSKSFLFAPFVSFSCQGWFLSSVMQLLHYTQRNENKSTGTADFSSVKCFQECNAKLQKKGFLFHSKTNALFSNILEKVLDL